MSECVETPEEAKLEEVEIRLLLEGVFQHCGIDFRDYAFASIRRRIHSLVRSEQLHSISGLQQEVLHDPACMERLLRALTVHVTSMFRDPSFYVALREAVLPQLRAHAFLRIWHAGCSSGEEVYSMAILLHEEGLYERCRIYATDLSDAVLAGAKSALFPLSSMKEYTENYQQAGGRRAFSEYYTARYDHAVFRPALRERIVFAQHSLATDASFNEFHMILCRNVLIYFNETLKDRVHSLLYDSLDQFGVLGLGRRESLHLTPHESCYEELEGSERLYRKVR